MKFPARHLPGTDRGADRKKCLIPHLLETVAYRERVQRTRQCFLHPGKPRGQLPPDYLLVTEVQQTVIVEKHTEMSFQFLAGIGEVTVETQS